MKAELKTSLLQLRDQEQAASFKVCLAQCTHKTQLFQLCNACAAKMALPCPILAGCTLTSQVTAPGRVAEALADEAGCVVVAGCG